MNKLLGIDLAKESFYFCGMQHRKVCLEKKVSRVKVLREVESFNPTTIYMEACGGAHFWARQFRERGYEVVLIPAQDVKPFVKGQKNDRNDALAIIEAGSRPKKTTVNIKTEEQQDIQSLHRVRDGFVKYRVALTNQLRGLLSEYGYVFTRGDSNLINGLKQLLSEEDICDKHSSTFKELAQDQLSEILRIKGKEERISKHLKQISKDNYYCNKLLKFPGVGHLTATAFYAAVGSGKHFRNGRHASAWLGLVPRQRSTGGKTCLLGITKNGDKNLRRLIIQGSRAKIISAKNKGDISNLNAWINKTLDKKGFNMTAIALSNKNVRAMIMVLKNDGEYIEI